MNSRRRWLPWARLIRLPNVFTCPGDVLVGYALASSGPGADARSLSLAVASSCFIYLSGMVWNDVFDVDVDRRERPQRPLPSGVISVRKAVATGSLLMVAGIGAACLAGPSTGLAAIMLSILVLSYDGLLKSWPVAPLVMGLCRGVNVMLGASAASTSALPWMDPSIAIAGAAHVIYVTGVTAYARREAKQEQHSMLLTAGVVSVFLGIALHFFNAVRYGGIDIVGGFLFAGLAGHLAAKFYQAGKSPIPPNIQSAVKSSVLGLIALDAAILACFGEGMLALVVLSLLLPAILLGRWLYST